MRPGVSGWLVDVVFGGLAGGLVSAVAALNLMIYLGPDSGYETSLPDLFAHSPLAGTLVVVALLAGPIAGVAMARRWRHRRESN